MTRLEVLQQTLQEECAQGCHGRWVEMAYDILTRNSIPFPEFAQAVHTLLDIKRGKYRNMRVHKGTNEVWEDVYLESPEPHLHVVFPSCHSNIRLDGSRKCGNYFSE